MKKRITLVIFVLSISLINTACGNHSYRNDTKQKPLQEKATLSIETFREYSWGTSFKDIKYAEVTDDMQEFIDYREDDLNGMMGLTIIDGNVAGYSTEIAYAFDDSGLIGGNYSLNINDESFAEWVKKYTDKYGDPALQKESTGWGSCALWADDSKNFIFLSGFYGISYVKANSPFLQFLNDGLYKYHEINLEEELNKIGNTDGI